MFTEEIRIFVARAKKWKEVMSLPGGNDDAHPLF